MKSLGLLTLAAFVVFGVVGCGSSDPAPVAGPAVGAPTPGGGTITSTPIQGKTPHMRR